MAERQDKALLLAHEVKYQKEKRNWDKPPKVDALASDLCLTIVQNLANAGLSQEKIAKIFGISPRQFRRKLQKNRDLAAAYKEGKIRAHLEVRQTAYALAVSGLDPATTRWMDDKLDREIDLMKDEPEESEIIDVENNNGPMTREEISRRLERAYHNDPMLRPDDNEKTTVDNSASDRDRRRPEEQSPEE